MQLFLKIQQHCSLDNIGLKFNFLLIFFFHSIKSMFSTPCITFYEIYQVYLRAEPILSCWHDLIFLWCLLLFYLLPSMGWLCGVGVFVLIVFSLSPGLAQRTPNNNNNNNYQTKYTKQHSIVPTLATTLPE